ncbi:Flp pilus assembly protein CpaB [Pseudoduganella albidiflava]|uniref:Flp pilus assembly protein CpaB n=1 Tax=Pseudoduganella albidiflava TaxID=321983 RepID=A0A411X110_9BURK|nr:Flp pilus assembly protein CpaB [Pseudoduganella albidiflava]QBI02654.1 Flp pilus assembly protein CpaB [Pseudoduganella albidiflava]GGY40951.1 pilus assembly-related, exported protein [Pseudoduganella albidiflava]
MRNSRPLLIIGVALFLALAAVLVAAKWMGEQGTAGTRVAVAAADIGQGSRLEAASVQLVDWPSGSVPPGAVTDPKLLAERVTRTDIAKGEPVLESKLAPPGTTGGLSAVVATGKRAMTVRVNDVVGVAGFALPGNYVDILVNMQGSAGDNGNAEQPISKIVLERILVLAVAQESNRDDTKPRVVNAVTLELAPDQVEKLDLARSVGSLSLVLRNQVDPQPANTGGATRESVLGLPPLKAARAAAPAPAPVRAEAPQRAAAPAPVRRTEGVLVIRGLDAAPQAIQ